jgi:hypothetical protein
MTQDARIPTHPRNITQESNADRGTHQPVAPVLILEARSALRSDLSRRDTYFERAAMAREMNRL